MRYTYQLRAEEIEEAWSCGSWRTERLRGWNQILLTILALGLVIGYARDSERFYRIVCAALAVALLFCNSYLLAFLRRRRADKLAKKEGVYGIEIGKAYIRAGKDWKTYVLEGRKWELLSSEHVYTLKIDREVFCVPKRALSAEGIAAAEALREVGTCTYRNIITGKER